MTSSPLYLTSRPLYLCHHNHPIDDITATIWMVSHPGCMWHRIHFFYDIISTKNDITHSVLMKPNAAYVWHPFHCRWHHVHSITPNHSIYDVTSTSGMALHPLYQTLHPLYLCHHHNVSPDITPTFEWHHTHLLCDIVCSIYNITSNPYVMTLLCLSHHSLYKWNHIQYVGRHIHYTWDITSTSCVLTPTV